MEQIIMEREAFVNLMRLKEELDLALESIELMNNSEVMESLKKSEEQIKNRDFANWDEL